jgi:hypothetical protein
MTNTLLRPCARTFAAGTVAFYAILATDNGKSFPWFLTQHRDQMEALNNKSVSHFYQISLPCPHFQHQAAALKHIWRVKALGVGAIVSVSKFHI